MEPRHEPTTPKPDYDRAAAIMPAPDVAEEADAGHPAIAHGELRPPAQERSIPYLLRQLTDQVTTLFTKEMALARSELRHAVSQAKTGVGSVAAGALVTFGGFLVLLFAAVWALDLVLSTWLSALIVGAVTVIVGAIMLSMGKNRLEPSAFKPERTAEQLRRDQAMAKAELRHGKAELEHGGSR
jgi:hypothetical protein